MDQNLIILLAAAILGFTSVFMSLGVCAPEDNANSKSFLPTYIVAFLGLFAIFFASQPQTDALFPITTTEILVFFALTSIIFLAQFNAKTAKLTPLLTFVGVAAYCFLAPTKFMLFEGNLPWILDRLAAIAIFFAFTHSLKYLNGVEGLVLLQAGTSSFVVFILFLLGVQSFFLGAFSLLFLSCIAAFLMFNWFPAKFQLSNGICSTIGFITVWILFRASVEGAGACAIIANSFLIVEVIWALIRKLLPATRNNAIYANTNYYAANLSGLSPSRIALTVTKLLGILAILSAFQIYAPNSYSLPLFCLLMSAWFANKLANWHKPDRSLKEINKDVLEDIKENFKSLSSKEEKDDNQQKFAKAKVIKKKAKE